MDSSIAPRLQLTGITKRFPGVLANDSVSFSVLPGEIHALLGENGAGKSTLMNIIYGLLAPDAGSIFLDGRPVRFAQARDARHAGIGMVHQELALIDALSVIENLALSMGPETR